MLNAVSVESSVPVESLTIGQGLIGSLLLIIIGLLIYIWKENKAAIEKRHQDTKDNADRRHAELRDNAELRHQDQLSLIKRMDERQSALEKRQAEMHDFQTRQHFELLALNKIINLLQGKPFDYNGKSSKDEG